MIFYSSKYSQHISLSAYFFKYSLSADLRIRSSMQGKNPIDPRRVGTDNLSKNLLLLIMRDPQMLPGRLGVPLVVWPCCYLKGHIKGRPLLDV